jgi:hypothetical protein
VAELEPSVKRWIAERLTRQAEFLGYAMDEPLPVAPLAPEGRFVASGHDVAARIDAFPDLDLRTRGIVPAPDRLYNPRELIVLPREEFEHATRRRGVRALGVRVVSRWSEDRRRTAQKVVHRIRAAFGLRRRPRRL